MFGMSAASIGLNFQDDWVDDGGALVTREAFGVPAARWFNMPRVLGSAIASGVSTNAVITLPEGGDLRIEWACTITRSLTGDIPTEVGRDEVIYGYLDDANTGYRVRMSGFRNVAAQYSLQLIASTDDGQGFADARLEYGSGEELLSYGEAQDSGFASGVFSTSMVSAPISTLATNNSLVIDGGARSGALRATLAGIIIEYTPGGANPPVVEMQSVSPSETVYEGATLTFRSAASGSPPLRYQWMLGGKAIDGATGSSFTKENVKAGDGGLYSVVVSNGFGSVPSQAMEVSVLPVEPPQIVQPPRSEDVYLGFPVSFEVVATGGRLDYQWKHRGQELKGETNTVLKLPSVGMEDRGVYSVVVRNPRGTAEASATLGVRTPRSHYEAAVASSKPLVYFRMSEPGPVVQDIAANEGILGATGTGVYVGAVRHGVPGALVGNEDAAISLEGGRLTVGFNSILNPPGSFTVECWANPLDVDSGPRVLVQSMINGENPENSSDRSGWSLRQNGASLEFLIGGTTGNPGYTTVATAREAVKAGEWRQYSAIYDSVTLQVSLLVNGIVVTNVEAAEALIPNYAAPLLIGNRGYGGWIFRGHVDEVALYPAALPPARLASHYRTATNAATSATYRAQVRGDGAVEYLRLDDAGLPPQANATANQGVLGQIWTGTYVGAGPNLGNPLALPGIAGPRPSELPGLDATNASLSLTNGWVTSPPLPLSDHVTAVCWLNRAEVSTTGDLSWPAWLGGGGLHLDGGTASNPDAELRYHWNGLQWDWGSGLKVPANVWTWVALVVEPDQATIYMSDSGVLTSSAHTEVMHAPMIVSSPPGFGGNQPDRSDRNYIGLIDEVAVYDRALAKSEIETLYASALSAVPGSPSPLEISEEDGRHVLTWTSGALQSSSSLSDAFRDVDGATSPYPVNSFGANIYYRLRPN